MRELDEFEFLADVSIFVNNRTFMKKLVTLIALSILCLISCKHETYYNLSTSVHPGDGGIIVMTPSSGSVMEGTTVTFKANPNGDYIFTGWSGSISGSENPKTVTVTSNMTVTANFTLRDYPLAVSVEGEGEVLERVLSTKTDYSSGTVVELNAKPFDHWVFDHWEGDLNGNTNPVQITVTSTKNVKAVFVKKMYDLMIDVEGEGSVSEKVVGTKSGSYQEGTTVELKATAGTGWSFDHWEGDLAGTDNPTQITISSAKSVKAIFAKKHYAYNLTIIGPGVVDEYLLPETKSEFSYGEKILLKAIPSEGAYFKGWSGDASGSELEFVLNIDENKDIVATFSGVAKSYPLPDLKQPWSSNKCLYKDFDFRVFSNDASGRSWTPVDYNRDGYLDVITTETFKENYYESDCDIHFFLGNPDGTFSVDPLNDNGLIGKEPRKVMYTDFNNDDKPDIVMLGHGTEQPGALWGSYPIILMSSSSGVYHVVRFEDLWGYHHGGTIGDIDNDGDIDIILPGGADCTTHTLINDGNGEFSVDNDYVVGGSGIFVCELSDINHDGFLDLVFAGSCIDGKWDGCFWRAEVIWGNGQTFNECNSMSYLIPCETSMEMFLDFEFMDLDGDGIDEVISATTTNYDRWGLEIYKLVGNDFIDITATYFEPGGSIGLCENWIGLIDLEELDGRMYLVCQQYGDRRMCFEFKNGKFNRIYDDITFSPQNGFTVYHDPLVPFNYYNEYVQDELYFNCTDHPYSGVYCIKNASGEWGFWINLSEVVNGADLSTLVSGGYSLEFYIRHDSPDLLVDIAFCSDPIGDQPGNAYSYTYRGAEHFFNGEWQRMVLPLNTLKSSEDIDCWRRINTLLFYASGDNRCVFYVDDIRIRKVLPGIELFDY